MHIPDNQRIAIFWNDKPIGLVYGYLYRPRTLREEIVILAWRGELLGEQLGAQSPNELYREARQICKAKGLHGIYLGNGADVTTIYTPAFEE